MFKFIKEIFSVQDSDTTIDRELKNLRQKYISQDRIEDLDDSILILETIQQAYDTKPDKNGEFKTYRAKKQYITNFINMSLERLRKKREELDVKTQSNSNKNT